ncbi:PAS domain-containing protein [Streptomyces coelicoflavus]|uniref:PAS domain-containing protein n=1 Tax=Streptomyces coelicoflavus TaxID=285562 RepID=UPI003320543B
MTGDPIGDTAVLNALFANSPQGLFVFDSEQRIARYNPAGRGVRGLSAEDVVGRRVEELAPGFEAGELQRLIDEVLATGQPLRGRLVRGRSPSDPQRTLAVEVSLFPLHDLGDGRPGLVGVAEDVTERQAAADRLTVLSEVHAAVGSTLDARTTADELVRALVPAFADAATVDLLDDGVAAAERPAGPPPTEVPLRRVSFAPPTAEVSRREGESRPMPFPTPYTQVLNDLRARLVRVSSDDPWLSTDPEGLVPLVRAGVHAMIVVPLTARSTVLGLLTRAQSNAPVMRSPSTTVPGDRAEVSLLSRTLQTVLSALVPGVLNPWAATRIACVIRSREASSLTTWPSGYGQRATERPQTFSPEDRGLRTLAPFPAIQIARSR